MNLKPNLKFHKFEIIQSNEANHTCSKVSTETTELATIRGLESSRHVQFV